MKNKTFLSLSSSQTKGLGKKIARDILSNHFQKKAVVIGLKGDLGGGKTTFVQGFALGLGIKEKIVSPTFVILKVFDIKKAGFQKFYHLDCYRIENPEDVSILELKEIISKSQNIVVIEWAEKIKKILPQNTIWLKFDFKGANERKIEME